MAGLFVANFSKSSAMATRKNYHTTLTPKLESKAGFGLQHKAIASSLRVENGCLFLAIFL
jgi:hypothetical protein